MSARLGMKSVTWKNVGTTYGIGARLHWGVGVILDGEAACLESGIGATQGAQTNGLERPG